MLIARTDARAVEGLEQALHRARMYREAGADALFIEAVMSEDEAAEAARAFPGVPLLFNWAEGGKTPPIGLDRLRELGYRIVIFPISTLLAATAGMRQVLGEIARSGTPAGAMAAAAPEVTAVLPPGGDAASAAAAAGLSARGAAAVAMLTELTTGHAMFADAVGVSGVSYTAQDAISLSNATIERSAGGNDPIARRTCVTSPLRPKKLTRTSSRARSSDAAFNASRKRR